MDLGVFALHTVLFPGQGLEVTVFEERYKHLLEDVLPEDPFAVVAIRRGQEVGGAYEPHPVGVRVLPEDYDLNDDATFRLEVRAMERIRLVRKLRDEPYARWEVARWPEEGAAQPEDVDRAVAAWKRFLDASELEAEAELPEDPALLSYSLAAVVPGMLHEHQALLEAPGPAERLGMLAKSFRLEAAFQRALKGRREG
jgi:Lon protease-like protein